MKRRFLQITTLLLAVIFFAICFTACNVYKSGEVSVKLISSTEESVVFTVTETDGKATAFDALKCLQTNGKLTFTSEDSGYGAFITAIGDKKNEVTESTANSSKGYSWMLYTSDTAMAIEETTTVIDGTTYYSSSVGASSLTVKKGETYVWVYEEYSYTW